MISLILRVLFQHVTERSKKSKTINLIHVGSDSLKLEGQNYLGFAVTK